MNRSLLWSPHDVAVRFVDAWGNGDMDVAGRMLAPDVVYTRTSWRTLRGRTAVSRHFVKRTASRGRLEAVLLHAAADDDGVVLTERVNALTYGRFRIQFWVCSRFEVREGRIAVWQDYFDYFEVAKAVARAGAGAAVPRLRPTFPRLAD
ncbi:limonene-1,2-epoxide hydrolase family protein [Tsukamurella sp. 8F]|uniref:limonene-1,2-epoxide hydrolase family protein n=1 Tax=unclassified Tsukamurella TaxID=2633480 RepID=UPI0023B8AEE8|nr:MULTISPECIES: limonene-1,2-epoxide hydrolase family protein [unclassified Tsukamurella]MDF0530251.1 limonene-1,2-epoxide hydrolase family protein [Tsukamurella sp. 8J]MDF0586568.1 limonene-1,2-epoxide hydrolase family protein [Tsukamurella sp. 8F]